MSNLLSAKAPGEMPWHGWQTVDPSTLEPFYSKWVGLLTSEGLHAKADIATVLAMLDKHASALAEQVERLTEYWGMPNDYTGGIAAWVEGEHDKDKRMSTFYREKWKAAEQRAGRMEKDAEKAKRIELAYCAANDYINAFLGTEVSGESLRKIAEHYWQKVREV